MINTLNGLFHDDKGNEAHICEAYCKQSDPCVIYRRDKLGRWRAYVEAKRGNKHVYRAIGLRVPLFAREGV